MTPPARSEPAATAGTAAPPAFEMLGGCVEFDGVHIFNHLDLAIERGSFVAVLGANGSGKTTLIRALLGLQPLSHGQIRIHGTPLGRYRDWSRISFVPQRLPGATGVPISVGELVLSGRYGPRTRLRPLRRADRDAVRHALEVVGLADRRSDRLDTLSGGQQRRAMVARAIATGGDTLVLDEPTAGMDLANQQRLAQSLAALPGHTVVMVAHGLGSMAGLVNRAIVLADGRIIHDGPDAPAAWGDVHHDSDARTPPTLLEG